MKSMRPILRWYVELIVLFLTVLGLSVVAVRVFNLKGEHIGVPILVMFVVFMFHLVRGYPRQARATVSSQSMAGNDIQDITPTIEKSLGRSESWNRTQFLQCLNEITRLVPGGV